MPRETVLAWVCLGLWELALYDSTLTGNKASAFVTPLYSSSINYKVDHVATALHHQVRAEACLRRALTLVKQLPSASATGEQLSALVWFALGAVYNLVPSKSANWPLEV